MLHWAGHKTPQNAHIKDCLQASTKLLACSRSHPLRRFYNPSAFVCTALMSLQFPGFTFYPMQFWATNSAALPSSDLDIRSTDLTAGNISAMYDACASYPVCASFNTAGSFRFANPMGTQAGQMNWISFPNTLGGTGACVGTYARVGGNVGHVTRECTAHQHMRPSRLG